MLRVTPWYCRVGGSVLIDAPLGGRVGRKAELRRCEMPSMRGCAYTIASAYVFPFTRTQPHAHVCHVRCAGALLLSVLSRRCASCTGVRSPCAGAHSCTGVRSSPPLPFQAAFARAGAGVCQTMVLIKSRHSGRTHLGAFIPQNYMPQTGAHRLQRPGERWAMSAQKYK